MTAGQLERAEIRWLRRKFDLPTGMDSLLTACYGKESVYVLNEIAAHAAGTHFDQGKGPRKGAFYHAVLPDLGMAAMLLHRVRYFSDGAVIGSREFVNAAFASARERFGAKRKDGARALRGGSSAAKGVLWSARDLRIGV